MKLTERIFIDGADAYAAFGMVVLEGGYDDLLSMPSLKGIETNDWQEENGLEVYTGNAVLASKESTLSVAFIRNPGGWDSLMDLLCDGVSHIFLFAEVGRILSLRLVSSSVSPDTGINGLVRGEIVLSNDKPLDDYVYLHPSSATLPRGDYFIDGRDISYWGITALEGTFKSFINSVTVKPALSRDVQGEPGRLYDADSFVRTKSRDAQMHLYMKEDSLVNLWRNYDAFLYDLVREGERVLTVQGSEYRAYYKSCRVEEISLSGKPSIKFTITFCLTGKNTDDDETI